MKQQLTHDEMETICGKCRRQHADRVVENVSSQGKRSNKLSWRAGIFGLKRFPRTPFSRTFPDQIS